MIYLFNYVILFYASTCGSHEPADHPDLFPDSFHNEVPHLIFNTTSSPQITSHFVYSINASI